MPQAAWGELELFSAWNRCIGVCRLLVYVQKLWKEDLRHGNTGGRLCILCGLLQVPGVQETNRGFTVCTDLKGSFLHVMSPDVDEEEEKVREDEAG